jgi:hypothetical protein
MDGKSTQFPASGDVTHMGLFSQTNALRDYGLPSTHSLLLFKHSLFSLLVQLAVIFQFSLTHLILIPLLSYTFYQSKTGKKKNPRNEQVRNKLSRTTIYSPDKIT